MTSRESALALREERGYQSLIRVPADGILRFLRREPLGAVGAVLFLTMIVVALLAPVLAPANPIDIRGTMTYRMPGPTALFGTDKFGRDILSRVIYGARVSLYVGTLTVVFGTSFGVLVGLFSAYGS